MQRGFVKRRGPSWTAFYYTQDPEGRRRQRTKGGFRTKSEAQAHLNGVMGSLHRHDYVEPQRLSLGNYLVDRWLPIMAQRLRSSTFDSYQRMIKLHVLPAIGPLPLQAVTADDLDRLYAELLKSGRRDASGVPAGLSARTVRYVHNIIRQALKDAERKRLVFRNVATGADPPKIRRSTVETLHTWTGPQVGRFLHALTGHRLHGLFLLAATTGMRRGELLGLRWQDVDPDGQRLQIRQAVSSVRYRLVIGPPKTARSRRSISLDSATLAALRAQRQRQQRERTLLGPGFQDNDLVFCKVDGRPLHPDYITQFWERTVARLDLPRIRLHDLRHTHATLGLAAGVAPKIMADRLGHATAAFTQDVYMHSVPALDQAAAEVTASLIFGAEHATDEPATQVLDPPYEQSPEPFKTVS